MVLPSAHSRRQLVYHMARIYSFPKVNQPPRAQQLGIIPCSNFHHVVTLGLYASLGNLELLTYASNVCATY